MKERYARNQNMLSAQDQAKLAASKVCVIGCGGLGGYIVEMLVRIGVGHITAIDGDVFDETNLNRQLLAGEKNLGMPKAEAALLRAKEINSAVSVNAVFAFLDESNASALLKGHNVVIDALDHVTTRKLVEQACEKETIPMVHGAIGGWYGQVAVILPGDRLLQRIYPEDCPGEETELGNPSFTPATVASIQVAECIKLLLGKDSVLTKKMLSIDLLCNAYELLEFEF